MCASSGFCVLFRALTLTNNKLTSIPAGLSMLVALRCAGWIAISAVAVDNGLHRRVGDGWV